MSKIADIIASYGLANKVFTDTDLKLFLDKSPASRYGLINKALKKGELHQLKRGCYLLAQKYQPDLISHFYIASSMIPHSYVSFESALSYHGWIPERVTVIASVIHRGRTKSFINTFGEFSYTYIPTEKYEFLSGVYREEINKQPFLIASPLRALGDLVYIQKIQDPDIWSCPC